MKEKKGEREMPTNEIGQRLRELRIQVGLTLDEVGKRIGVSKQAIYKYETGITTNIPLDKIEELAKLYHVSPAEIMGWDETDADENYYHDPEAAALADMIKDNPRYRVLFEASRDLSKENIDFVIKMIENLPKGDEDFSE